VTVFFSGPEATRTATATPRPSASAAAAINASLNRQSGRGGSSGG
jgi:hypothetical protein